MTTFFLKFIITNSGCAKECFPNKKKVKLKSKRRETLGTSIIILPAREMSQNFIFTFDIDIAAHAGLIQRIIPSHTVRYA